MSPDKPSSDNPSAADVSDPALRAEIDNPADSNAPTGEEATPEPTAADEGGIAAPGAPEELRSTDPDQGDPDTAPATDAAQEADTDRTGDEQGAAGVQGADAPAAKGPTDSTAGDDESAPDATAPDQPSAVSEAEDSTTTSETPPVDSVKVDDAVAVDTPVAAEELASSDTPAATEPEPEELDEARTAVVDALRAAIGDDAVLAVATSGADLVVRVATDRWRQAGEVCRNDLGLTYFGFLSAVDWLPSPYGKSEDGMARSLEDVRQAVAKATDHGPLEHGVAGGETRFQVFARVYSIARRLGVTLKADVADDDPVIETWTGVYPGANWHEREASEMYGIAFAGHPYPAKLYLPGDFEGFPLRKDFPLLAREVKPWPGIVDVEAMPGEAPTEGDEEPVLAEEAS